MRAKCVALNCLFIFFSALINALAAQTNAIPRLEITTSKTTVIVSHYQIRSVDRGSRDILVQKVNGVDTLLEVKAARPDFPESNLTIITGDGQVHMFVVTYRAQPANLLVVLAADARGIASAVQDNRTTSLTDADYEVLSDSVMQQRRGFKKMHDQFYGVTLTLLGIWIHDDVLLFHFRLKNKSAIGYDVGQINFYIRDQKQSKRTAAQDLAMIPLSINGPHDRVRKSKADNFVVALPKFTIPNKKILFIVFKEEQGGRLLRLKIKNKHLMRAKTI